MITLKRIAALFDSGQTVLEIHTELSHITEMVYLKEAPVPYSSHIL